MTTTTSDQNFQKQWLRLKSDYCSSLPATVIELQSLSGKTTTARPDLAAFEQVKSIAHRLAGSGGTFGFNRLSQTARTLDRYMIAVQEQVADKALSDETCIKLTELITSLTKVIQEASMSHLQPTTEKTTQ